MIRKKLASLVIAGSTFIIAISTNSYAATLKGHVLDAKTKEALLGTTVYDKDNTVLNGVVGLDGSYIVKNIPKGTYTFVAKFFGYETIERSISVTDSNQIIVQDFMMDASSINLGQVQVIASADKGSDNFARTEEKNSDNVMNVMSAKTIQLLPDITIGDVLQRVSGVVAERSLTGGGQYANIRGMDKQYNYTTIDDVKIPSPDLENRYVPMDIFPSEMVERLEVIKSLTPDKEGDAIGGAMNLILKDGPDAFTFNANVATGFDQTLLNKGYEEFNPNVINTNSPAQMYGPNYKATVNDFPTANLDYKDVTAPPNLISGFTIGDRFFGGRFGILVSANYQNVYSATEGLWIKLQSQPEYSPTYNTPDWDFISNRYYSDQQTRGAGHIKMDYIFSPKHRISFYTVYTQMNEVRSRIEQDTTNSLPNSEMDPHYQSKVTYQHVLSSTLKGKDTLAHHLLLDWTGAYSRAWANTPDWDDISILGSVGGSPPPVFSGLSRVWQQSNDQDIAGYVNLTYDFTVFGQKVELKAGAMNRDKSRNAYYNEYDFNATPTQPSYTDINAILANPNYYVFVDPLGYPGDNNTYTVQEDVNAIYGMAKLNFGNHVQLLGGIREENTSDAYQDAEPADLAGKYGSSQYTDILPSVELKYSFTDIMAIRGSYFASIARPGFADAVPTSIATDEFTQIGNPYLQHTTANNYDIRYEYFPKPSDQILVGVFYKQIYNPIELSIVPGSGPSATYQEYQNIGGDSVPVINYGFEFEYTKYFWRVFGVSANYTYTHSAITVNELKLGTSSVPGESINERKDTVETRPMQGQVNNIANLSFIYKEPKLGLEAQIAVVYTGKSVYTTSSWYGLDQWEMPMTRLDFSFEKKLSKKINLSLYGKINNILNTPLTIRMFPPNAYANTPGTAAWLPNQDNNGSLSSIVVQKEYYGQTYLLGVRYKF